MVSKHTKRSAKNRHGISYKRANLFDIPLVFELLQDGAERGAFSEDFIQHTGSVKLLRYLFKSIALQFFQSPKADVRYEWQLITLEDGKEVGFFMLNQGIGECLDRNLQLLAISPSYRNKGIGTAVIDHVASGVPEGARLYVHCTKYARAMQHILKRHGLRRNVKFGVPCLEEYRSVHSNSFQHGN